MQNENPETATMTGRTELVLLPTHHLESTDAGTGTGLRTWTATGDDPQFVLAPRDRSQIEGGWYLFEADLRPIDRPIKQPVLYPDYGAGQNEFVRIPLPIKVAAGRPAPVLVRFDHPVRSLRYDPTMSAGSFALGPVHLQRVGRWRAGSLMLSQALETCTDWRGKMQVLTFAASTLLSGGPRGLAEWLYQKVLSERVEATLTNDYASWLRQYDIPVPSDIEERLAGLPRRPLISVVMPTYNTPERWLRKCIQSVRGQAYPHWELCIADDASSKRHVRKVLAEYERLDPRIRVVYRAENGHISDASNSALALAKGEYVALLDHDDELHPMALYEVAKAVNEHPRWKLMFSDEDKMDEAGRRSSPYFKADWNYDLLLSQNCVSHLGVYDTQLMRDVGGFRKGFEGSQDHDLTLRCVERLEPAQIGHIPKVLYHWRMVEGSTARGASEKNYAATAGCRAISEHLQRSGVKADVEVTMQGYYKVRYALPEPPPLVSLIIPTRDKVELLRMCVESILAKTDYPDYEILVVDNQSSEQSALDYLDGLQSQPGVRVLRYDAPFNFSAINNFAARQARGEVLALVNNDLEINQPGWLRELTSHACREGVGAVGCLLYYPDDTIQHAGVLTGLHGV
ncbi:MAG: glycosyltransferase, partial [Lysobacteraceae bacterium]